MFLIFDLGGTRSKIALTKGDNIDNPKILDTPKNFEEGVEMFKYALMDLPEGEKVEAVVGGIAAPLSEDRATILKFPHIPDWAGKPLKDELAKLTGAPVFLENDAALAGLGEATDGAGQGYDIVAYMTISTGVGGVRVVDKTIDKSVTGFEIGHQIVELEGIPCAGCGGRGHLEAYISGSAMEAKYGKRAEMINDKDVWEEIAKYTAVGVVNTILYWSPDVVVLGGGMMHKIDLEQVKTFVNTYLKIFPKAPEIKKSTLNNLAGLHGGLQHLRNLEFIKN